MSSVITGYQLAAAKLNTHLATATVSVSLGSLYCLMKLLGKPIVPIYLKYLGDGCDTKLENADGPLDNTLFEYETDWPEDYGSFLIPAQGTFSGLFDPN